MTNRKKDEIRQLISSHFDLNGYKDFSWSPIQVRDELRSNRQFSLDINNSLLRRLKALEKYLKIEYKEAPDDSEYPRYEKVKK